MMDCKKHGIPMRMVRCPDGRPGCLVAHFACGLCRKEHAEAETLEALQQGSGVEPGPIAAEDGSPAK